MLKIVNLGKEYIGILYKSVKFSVSLKLLLNKKLEKRSHQEVLPLDRGSGGDRTDTEGEFRKNNADYQMSSLGTNAPALPKCFP